jgi:hypothetical protein
MQSEEDKVVVLLTKFDSHEPRITGYFDGGDFYPGEGNEEAMFYVNTNGSKNTILTAAAHQYQHMLFFMNKARLNRTADDFWLNQGLAHVATQVCGYIDFEKEGWSEDEANGWVYDEKYGYLHNTDQVNVLYHDGTLPFTGASSLFTAYLMEQYGPELISQKIMMNSKDPVKVIEKETGKSIEKIFTNWLTTNVTDNIEDIDGEVYNYSAFDLKMMPAFEGGSVSKTGVSYFEVPGSGGDVSVPLPDDVKEDMVIVVIKTSK